MAKLHESPVRLAVLNPKGRDPYLDYSGGIDAYEKGVHAPINFHAYAAATFGAFYDSTDQLIADSAKFDAAIVLIRRRTWITLDAVRKLKSHGIRVLVTWKESGHFQIAGQLGRARAHAPYGEILREADWIVSPTSALPPRLGQISYEDFIQKAVFIPTPYAVDYPDWDFSKHNENCLGIMLGTREFGVPARNHFQALLAAANLACELKLQRVTVINSNKKKGLKRLREIEKSYPGGCLNIIENPLAYLDYMRLLSSHRVIFQMDRSGVPGQVAGDSLLGRTICAGGNSTIEQTAFQKFSDNGSLTGAKVLAEIKRVITDDAAYSEEVRTSQEIAADSLSFGAVAKRFEDLLQT